MAGYTIRKTGLNPEREGPFDPAPGEDLGLARAATAERRFRLPGGCGTF